MVHFIETSVQVRDRVVGLLKNGRTILRIGSGYAPIIQGIVYLADEMVIVGKLTGDLKSHLYTLESFGLRNTPRIKTTLEKVYRNKKS